MRSTNHLFIHVHVTASDSMVKFKTDVEENYCLNMYTFFLLPNQLNSLHFNNIMLSKSIAMLKFKFVGPDDDSITSKIYNFQGHLRIAQNVWYNDIV